MFLSALTLSKLRGSWRLSQYAMILLQVSLLFVSSPLLIDTCRSPPVLCSSLSACVSLAHSWGDIDLSHQFTKL